MSISKNATIYILSFLIPIIFILLSCITSGIFPFGENEFLYSDCNIEYIHFLSYLKHTLFSNDNLIYSLSNTGGNEMISFSSHYLLSPLNLITLLFPDKYINFAIQIIMILKLAFCGLFFAIFLNKTFENRYANIVFAASYALSSYNLMNISNFMYFDGIALLPLTILGIYEIVKKNKYILYIVSVSATIIFNSFIGYVVLLFSFLFFIYLITIKFLVQNSKIKEILSNIKTYIFSTVISLGLASILLLPLFLSLSGSAKYNFFELNHGLFEIRTSVFEILTKFLTGAFEVNGFIAAKSPHLFVGIFLLILAILYFLNKAISRKERTISAAFLLLLFLSFIVNILFTTWNMGVENPCGTIFRFGFVFEFFFVYIAYISFLHLKSLNIKNIITASVILILLFTIIFFKCNNTCTSVHAQFLANDVVLSLSFITLLYFYISDKMIIRNKPLIIFSVIFILHLMNLFFNTEYAIYSQPRFHFSSNCKVFSQYYNRVNNALKYIYSIDDNKFLYRIETNITNLDSMLILSSYINASFTFGYSSLSGHTSNADNDKTMFYYYIGMPSKNNYYNISYTTNTTNFPLSLMGVKYIISNEKINQKPYELIKTLNYNNENTYIYLNKFSLPTAFLASDSVTENKLSLENHFNFQNNLIKNIADEDYGNIFDYAKVNVKPINWDNTIDNNYEILLGTNNIKYDNAYIYYDVTDQDKINDDTFDKFMVKNGNNKFNLEYTELYHNSIYIGKVNYNPVSVFLNKTHSLKDVIPYTQFYIVNENLDVSKKYFEKISENSYKIEKLSGSNFRINCKIEDRNKVLLTTIPYSKNWKITVDGKKAEYYPIYNALLAIPVEEGKHQIDIKYIPQGLWLGFILSLISLFMLIIYNKQNKI